MKINEDCIPCSDKALGGIDGAMEELGKESLSPEGVKALDTVSEYIESARGVLGKCASEISEYLGKCDPGQPDRFSGLLAATLDSLAGFLGYIVTYTSMDVEGIRWALLMCRSALEQMAEEDSGEDRNELLRRAAPKIERAVDLLKANELRKDGSYSRICKIVEAVGTLKAYMEMVREEPSPSRRKELLDKAIDIACSISKEEMPRPMEKMILPVHKPAQGTDEPARQDGDA